MSPSLPELSPLGPPDPSIPKAAEMIGVSERTMRRAVERGEIEAYKLLGNTRVKLPSLHLFVQRPAAPLAACQPRQAATRSSEKIELRVQRRVIGNDRRRERGPASKEDNDGRSKTTRPFKPTNGQG
jgi:excisionase family DNA binding protein